MKIVIIDFIPLMQQSSRDFFMLFSKSFLTSLFSRSVATLLIVSDQLLFENFSFSTIIWRCEIDTTLCQEAETLALAGSEIVVVDTGAGLRAKAASTVS